MPSSTALPHSPMHLRPIAPRSQSKNAHGLNGKLSHQNYSCSKKRQFMNSSINKLSIKHEENEQSAWSHDLTLQRLPRWIVWLLSYRHSIFRLLTILCMYLLCIAFHGVCMRIAYYRGVIQHNMVGIPRLPDVGQELLPNLQAYRWIPEILYLIPVTIYIGYMLYFHDERLFLGLRMFLTSHGSLFVLRALSFVSTTLPDSSMTCHMGNIYTGSCHDLIFSGHEMFVTLSVLCHWAMFKRHTPRWMLLMNISLIFITGGFIIATRNHYSVDVIISMYVTPLMHWTWQTHPFLRKIIFMPAEKLPATDAQLYTPWNSNPAIYNQPCVRQYVTSEYNNDITATSPGFQSQTSDTMVSLDASNFNSTAESGPHSSSMVRHNQDELVSDNDSDPAPAARAAARHAPHKVTRRCSTSSSTQRKDRGTMHAEVCVEMPRSRLDKFSRSRWVETGFHSAPAPLAVRRDRAKRHRLRKLYNHGCDDDESTQPVLCHSSARLIPAESRPTRISALSDDFTGDFSDLEVAETQSACPTVYSTMRDQITSDSFSDGSSAVNIQSSVECRRMRRRRAHTHDVQFSPALVSPSLSLADVSPSEDESESAAASSVSGIQMLRAATRRWAVGLGRTLAYVPGASRAANIRILINNYLSVRPGEEQQQRSRKKIR